MAMLQQCVSSLYDDQVRPMLAIIRRRYHEIAGEEVSLSELADRLAEAPWARLTGPASNPCALLFDRTPPFVDPLDPSDPYPLELWRKLTAVLDDMSADNLVFRGGRYGCAQDLKQHKVLESYSLGQVQHMVQLLIDRFHLRYVRSGKGTLAPRARSCCSTASSSGSGGSRGASPQKWEHTPVWDPPTLDLWAPTVASKSPWAPAGAGWGSLCSMPVDGPELEQAAAVTRPVETPPTIARHVRVGFDWVVPCSKLRSKDKVAVSRVLTTRMGSFKLLLTPRGADNFATARQGALQLKCLDAPSDPVHFRLHVGTMSAVRSHVFTSCAVSAAVLVDLPALRPCDAGLAVTLEIC